MHTRLQAQDRNDFLRRSLCPITLQARSEKSPSQFSQQHNFTNLTETMKSLSTALLVSIASTIKVQALARSPSRGLFSNDAVNQRVSPSSNGRNIRRRSRQLFTDVSYLTPEDVGFAEEVAPNYYLPEWEQYTPGTVIFPGSVEALQNTMQWARENNASLTPTGGKVRQTAVLP